MSTNATRQLEIGATTDDEPTCNNGSAFCPGAHGENATHARDDALECFDCFVIRSTDA